MSTHTNIQSALDSRLDALGLTIDINWPNTNYIPTGESFIRVMLLPIINDLATINDKNRFEGIYQIDILTPLEKGTAELNSLVDTIREHFNSNKILTAGTDKIYIQQISRGQTVRDDAATSTKAGVAFYKTNLDINFFTYS
jgi:hypothetical protein